MRWLKKSREPGGLLAYRKLPGARYDSLPAEAKDQVRRRLVEDQAWLCGYCMQRITEDPGAVKIEHRVPQTVDESRALAWRNMLGVCPGNEGSPPAQQHCDTRKGNEVITVNPFERSLMATILYTAEGRVRSTREDLQRDLDERLNLNWEALVRRRREAVLGMADALGRRAGQAFSNARLITALQRCQQPDGDGRLPPFVGVLEWWLKRRLGVP